MNTLGFKAFLIKLPASADIHNVHCMKYIFTITISLVLCVIFLPLHAQENGKQSETYKKASKYFFQQKYDMAELLFQEEIHSNPENGMAYSYLGDIFLNKKQYDSALALYKKAIELKSNNAEDYFRIGQVYYYKQLGDLSIENFRKALSANSNLKFCYYQIGLSYLMLLRDKQNVINNWETYLSIAPEDPQYEKIRRVLELLKDPNFELPPPGSDISIEEALHLGGAVLQKGDVKTNDKSAGHEGKKTVNKTEDIFRDDALQ
jgi:tetratricopeptide (TPR) repeat protein